MKESATTTMMKAAIATGVVDFDKYIHVKNDWPRPTLDTAIDGKTGKRVVDLVDDGHMIIQVLACALAPGDCRLFKGKTDMMQLPKGGRPYVIGSDVCGIVTEVGKDETYFNIGDKVIARFDEPQPHGMCAEYACVKTKFSEKCPISIPAIEACTLPASAAAAKLVATKFLSSTDRVLLLGASGGVGTFFCQYAKNIVGVSYLAATTTQGKLAKSLGVDRVIDYRKENWWELESEYKNQPFDVVVDLVNGRNWQRGACSGTKVLKKKAKYLQLMSGVETEIDVSWGMIGVVPLMFQMIGRLLYSTLHPNCPKYIMPQGLDLQPGDLKGILEDVEQGRIKVILDPSSPFPFEEIPVRQAMKLQNSIHAHGKVVVKIKNEK